MGRRVRDIFDHTKLAQRNLQSGRWRHAGDLLESMTVVPKARGIIATCPLRLTFLLLIQSTAPPARFVCPAPRVFPIARCCCRHWRMARRRSIDLLDADDTAVMRDALSKLGFTLRAKRQTSQSSVAADEFLCVQRVSCLATRALRFVR